MTSTSGQIRTYGLRSSREMAMCVEGPRRRHRSGAVLAVASIAGFAGFAASGPVQQGCRHGWLARGAHQLPSRLSHGPLRSGLGRHPKLPMEQQLCLAAFAHTPSQRGCSRWGLLPVPSQPKTSSEYIKSALERLLLSSIPLSGHLLRPSGLLNMMNVCHR